MVKADPQIAIIGAGPIGIEAALYARYLKLPFAVYERGEPAEHMRQWGHVTLFSPFGMNTTPLGVALLHEIGSDQNSPKPDECITGHRHIDSYLKPLVESAVLRDSIRSRTEVLHIGRRNVLKHQSRTSDDRSKQPFLLHVRDKDGERMETADVVLDCTGTLSQPRWMGSGGIPALGEEKIFSQIAHHLPDILGRDKQRYAGKTTLVIGTGYSAATTVCSLADLASLDSSTWVLWLTRGTRTQPIKRIANDPLKSRDKLGMRANALATRPDSNVEHYNQTVIDRVEKTEGGFAVHTSTGGSERVHEVDEIIANVGYSPDTNLYRELQVHECYASLGPMNLAAELLKQSGADCLSIKPQGADVLRNPEPGFFILGTKSYGRGSNFLLRTGFEQIRTVYTLITGKKDLNLYG